MESIIFCAWKLVRMVLLLKNKNLSSRIVCGAANCEVGFMAKFCIISILDIPLCDIYIYILIISWLIALDAYIWNLNF